MSKEKRILKITDLVKEYGNKVQAVKSISFDVKEGEFLAFLGVNGAGKSTTINMISTLLEMTSGEIDVDGLKMNKDDVEIRNKIGLVFQDSILDLLLTVKENLMLKCSLYEKDKEKAKKRVEEVITQLDLNSYAKQYYKDLSGGQRRRADIARALLHKPKILILDEPTTGLDPHTRVQVWNTIKKLKEETNMTVVLTTHYMEETIDCDRVIIIHQGSIIEEGTPEELRLKHSKDKLILVPKNTEKLLEISKELQVRNLEFTRNRDTLVVLIDNSLSAIEILNMHQSNLVSFEVIQGTMDDVFISLTEEMGEK